MTARRRLVIVGNGMAGSRLVEELRRRGAAAKWAITVLGAEARPAYNRVLLSNVLAGSATAGSIGLTSDTEVPAVDVRLGVTVTCVDRRGRRVTTTEGDVAYDALVLATGSVPVMPPIEGLVNGDGRLVQGAAVFRTLDDCERILELARGARRAVVLGGGLLGLEAARGLAGRGLRVDLVHRARHLMERQIDAGAGAVLARTVEALGVRVHTDATTVAVVGDGAAAGVRLGDGTLLGADLVVVACGVVPEISLARDCGLAVGQGIVVDDSLRTSDPDVYALGECAQHEGEVYGLVAPAWEQAVVLADVLGDPASPARYTGSRLVTRLKAAGVELAAMGDVMRDAAACDGDVEVLQFVDATRGTYKKLVLREGRVAGAILIGDVATVGAVTQLYDRGAAAPHDRLALLFPTAAAADAQTPARIPDRATVCRCNGVTKGAITACWIDGARTTAEVAAVSRATTGCGTCRSTVDGIVDWLAAAAAEERSDCA